MNDNELLKTHPEYDYYAGLAKRKDEYKKAINTGKGVDVESDLTPDEEAFANENSAKDMLSTEVGTRRKIIGQTVKRNSSRCRI